MLHHFKFLRHHMVVQTIAATGGSHMTSKVFKMAARGKYESLYLQDQGNCLQ